MGGSPLAVFEFVAAEDRFRLIGFGVSRSGCRGLDEIGPGRIHLIFPPRTAFCAELAVA
jgi:hypothetical protein